MEDVESEVAVVPASKDAPESTPLPEPTCCIQAFNLNFEFYNHSIIKLCLATLAIMIRRLLNYDVTHYVSVFHDRRLLLRCLFVPSSYY